MVIGRAQRANSKINFWGEIVSRYLPVRKSIFEPKKPHYRRLSSRLHEICGLKRRPLPHKKRQLIEHPGQIFASTKTYGRGQVDGPGCVQGWVAGSGLGPGRTGERCGGVPLSGSRLGVEGAGVVSGVVGATGAAGAAS